MRVVYGILSSTIISFKIKAIIHTLKTITVFKPKTIQHSLDTQLFNHRYKMYTSSPLRMNKYAHFDPLSFESEMSSFSFDSICLQFCLHFGIVNYWLT